MANRLTWVATVGGEGGPLMLASAHDFARWPGAVGTSREKNLLQLEGYTNELPEQDLQACLCSGNFYHALDADSTNLAVGRNLLRDQLTDGAEVGRLLFDPTTSSDRIVAIGADAEHVYMAAELGSRGEAGVIVELSRVTRDL